MNKTIFYYDDIDGLNMLTRCMEQYVDSRNYNRTGIQSIVVYANNTRTAYFKRNKNGTITAKAWLTDKEIQ